MFVLCEAFALLILLSVVYLVTVCFRFAFNCDLLLLCADYFVVYF